MKHYRFIDYATQGYLLLVGLLIVCFHGSRVRGWGWLLLAHVVCIGLVHWLITAQARHPGARTLDFLRHFYPILLYTGFYRETGALNQMFLTGLLDHHFIRMDEALFGFQPSLAFMDRLPYLWVSELLYAAYFSYYIMITGVGLALFLRSRAQFIHYVSVISFVFYCCYLVYIFLPVLGPRVFFYGAEDIGFEYHLPPDLQDLRQSTPSPDPIQAGVFYQLMKFIYEHFESPGAAFPSSHVAIALCTLFFSAKYLPRIRVVHAVVVLLLCVSTVYGRYHYVVDVFGGAVAAGVLLPLGNWLYRRYGGSTAP